MPLTIDHQLLPVVYFENVILYTLYHFLVQCGIFNIWTDLYYETAQTKIAFLAGGKFHPQTKIAFFIERVRSIIYYKGFKLDRRQLWISIPRCQEANKQKYETMHAVNFYMYLISFIYDFSYIGGLDREFSAFGIESETQTIV